MSTTGVAVLPPSEWPQSSSYAGNSTGRSMELDRDFTYDETQALGAAAEEELLRKELQREMVREILRRIALIG